MLFAALLALTALTRAQAPPAGEYQVKATFLYHFTQFIEWPTNALPEKDQPLVIGVLGEDSFQGELEKVVQGETVQGRKLEVRRIKDSKDAREARHCQVLFISASEKARLPQIFDLLKNAAVLTVGEANQFCQQGGLVNFTLKASKVNFEINLPAAQSAGFKIHSRLLNLATVIREAPATKK